MAPVYRVAGTIVAAVGGYAWDCNDDTGLMRTATCEETGENDATFVSATFADVPTGVYQFKICVDGSWDNAIGLNGQTYPGCDNCVVNVTEITDVIITLDTETKEVFTDFVDLSSFTPSTPRGVITPTVEKFATEVWESIKLSAAKDIAARSHQVSVTIIEASEDEEVADADASEFEDVVVTDEPTTTTSNDTETTTTEESETAQKVDKFKNEVKEPSTCGYIIESIKYYCFRPCSGDTQANTGQKEARI